jgi:hypothetical protein
MEIRKLVTIVEETVRPRWIRLIRPPAKRRPSRLSKIPLPVKYVEDLTPLMDMGEELGGHFGRQGARGPGYRPGAVRSYGKAAIVGLNGELEHGGAILHPKLGALPRRLGPRSGLDSLGEKTRARGLHH